MEAIRVLLVVDGFLSVGPRDINVNSFSVSCFKERLGSLQNPSVILTTTHRDGDLYADLQGQFDFAKYDLSEYDVIWMIGYNGHNGSDPLNAKNKHYVRDDELLAIAKFMANGGGVFATGDHEGLGSFMCGRIPRVRTMRKWFARNDKDEHIPDKAPRNWPVSGPERADTIQPAADNEWLYENQSDDIPQPLNIISVPDIGIHPILRLETDIVPARVLDKYPDHFHEGEVLGFGGVDREDSKPWTLTDILEFKGESFVEYPKKDEHQEVPWIIATGNVIPDHQTSGQPEKNCDTGFRFDESTTQAKSINTISVYDGHRVDVGRVVTDSSFHHITDINVIGDLCAHDVRSKGLKDDMLDDLTIFWGNTVRWLAHPRKQKKSN